MTVSPSKSRLGLALHPCHTRRYQLPLHRSEAHLIRACLTITQTYSIHQTIHAQIMSKHIQALLPRPLRTEPHPLRMLQCLRMAKLWHNSNRSNRPGDYHQRQYSVHGPLTLTLTDPKPVVLHLFLSLKQHLWMRLMALVVWLL